MTNELINYLKTQVSSGVAREKIISDLLGQGGWTMEQINEAFRHADQSIPVQMSYQATAMDMTQTPVSIKYFEWLMYASFLASIGIWVFQFGSTGFQAYILTAFAVPIIGVLLKFFCVYMVAYHRVKWARIVLVVLFALNAFSILRFFFDTYSNLIFLVTALPIILEIAAIYFVFEAQSNAWLAKNSSTQEAGAYITNNTKWTNVIPGINKIFTIISVGVFVVVVLSFGGPSVFTSSDLAVFAFAMLGTVIVIGAINYFETFSLAKRYVNSNSRLDTWFTVLAVLRNLVLFLSVLPFIQIIGMYAMVFGGIPYLIVYYFLVHARNKSAITV
jgi:hypothetical protein